MTESAKELTLKEQITKIIKDTCHFAAEDGQCSAFHECDLTNCKYANEQVTKILALGLVQLDEDQELSKEFWGVVRNYPGEISNELKGQGFRKVKGAK